MKPFDFQLIQWKCIPSHRHPLLSVYEARRLVQEPSCCVVHIFLTQRQIGFVCGVHVLIPRLTKGGCNLQHPLRFFPRSL